MGNAKDGIGIEVEIGNEYETVNVKLEGKNKNFFYVVLCLMLSVAHGILYSLFWRWLV